MEMLVSRKKYFKEEKDKQKKPKNKTQSLVWGSNLC